MFGREFTGKGHRQHVLPPNPTSYSFEKVGSTREALGLSGLSVGDEVYWYGGGDDVDTSASGVIVELPAVDPDGRVHSDMAAVEWSDDGYDIVEINNLLNAEHYNIGQGYSQALGSRKQADAYMDELKEWQPVEYDAFMESLGPGTVYEPGELEVIHKRWQQTQDPFDEGGDSYSASRKQASSLTWGHETAEQSLLGQEGWFANSGDGFHASIFEADGYIQLVPGAQRFDVDIYTDSNNYEHVSVNESGFESVDEAKSFVEGVFERSRVASRTAAGKCPKCDGMGRETYETDTGSLSTQTCKACGGTGQAKEAARKTAFLDTIDLPEPRHRVAGWDWDDHLNGFLAAEAAREFTCSCGANVPAPGYTDCHCGRRWNAYTIQANGSKKMIAREVPVRENVVMARTARREATRKQAELWEDLDSRDYEAVANALGGYDQAEDYWQDVRSAAPDLVSAIRDLKSDMDQLGVPLKVDQYWNLGSRKTAADASYEGWTARIIYDKDDFEYAETTTPSGEQADSIYPMDGSHFEGGELREALEELAREWGDDAYSGTYQYNSHRQAASYNLADVQADPSIVQEYDFVFTSSGRHLIEKVGPVDSQGIMRLHTSAGDVLMVRSRVVG